jgi:fatty-acyl-CoA synthase
MPLPRRLIKLKRVVDVVSRGARLFKQAGLVRSVSPLAALKLMRDRRRGSLGVIHFHAVSDPLRPAIVDGEQRLNYAELEARIHRLTHALAELGIGPGERIATLLYNCHEYAELTAALGAVRGVSAQIGFRLKPPEVAYLLKNSGARALLFHGDLAATVEQALAHPEEGTTITRDQCIAVGGAPGFRSFEELLERGDPTEPRLLTGAGFGGVMVYTSGTTGHSKGAKRDFARMGYLQVFDFLSQFPIARDERHLVLCPMYHSMGLAFATFVTLVGGCNVIVRHFDPEETLRLIERERITSTLVVPTMLTRIIALGPEVLRKYDLSSLRWIMSGAAPLPTELARQVEDAVGPILYNFYGSTETGLVTLARPGEHTARPGTIGRAIAGNDIRLLDGEGQEVPEGQVGELFVKNGMMMDGYHDNREATQQAMREGFITVGDLAWRDADGYYYLADRKTDMVISGGVNIYPWEIEQRLHMHPSVQEAAVVGVPDPEWGETLVAFVVLRAGRTATPTELIDHVRAELADYKRPRRVVFVDALPRNPTGKVLKRELKTQAQAQAAV